MRERDDMGDVVEAESTDWLLCAVGHEQRVWRDGAASLVAAVAEDGMYCEACVHRAGWRLLDAAELLGVVRERVVPSIGGAGDGVRVAGGGLASERAVLDADALAAADQLFASLTYWVRRFADEWSLPVLEAVASLPNTVEGVPAAWSGAECDLWGRRVIAWCTKHRGILTYSDTFGDFLTDLAGMVRDVPARYRNLDVRPRVQRARECPLCSAVQVRVTWDDDASVPTCACGRCGLELSVLWPGVGWLN